MTELRLMFAVFVFWMAMAGCSRKEETGSVEQGETAAVKESEPGSAATPAPAETEPSDAAENAAESPAEAPASPEDGGPRDWRVKEGTGPVELREEPSESAEVLTTYAPGTILDNLGVRRDGEKFWCDVQELGGGPRGFLSPGHLEPAVSPDGTVATGPDDSALRAGQEDFDATGTLVCTQGSGQPVEACRFGVSRAGGGYATVVIQRPQGHPRTIYFRMGRAIGAGFAESDPRGEFSVSREGDLHVVRLGRERYEIPDLLIYGH